MQKDKQNNMLEFLKTENDYITYLLEAFEVPETVESKWNLNRNNILTFMK